MNRIAPASLGFALAALAVAITAIVVCWTWLLVPCAAFTALALGCVVASVMGQIEVGIPCVVGGALSGAALKWMTPQ